MSEDKKDMHRISDIFYGVNLLEGAIPVEQQDGMFALRNITIIKAGLSQNRNFYPPEVLKRDSKVFEGTQIRTDHPSANRDQSVRDIVGKISNVRFSDADKAVRGDAVFSSAEKELVTKIKERLIGDVSINAFGTTFLEKGSDGKVRRRVKSLNSAVSVDLVCEASAGGSLHEDKRQTLLICERMVELMDGIDNLKLEELKASRPDLVEALKVELSPPPPSNDKTALLDIDSLKEAVSKEVDNALKSFEERQEKKEKARELKEAITAAVTQVIEESTMIAEAKPVICKSLTVFANNNFKDVAAIDMAKLSEERDLMLESLTELGKKLAESDKKDGKQKKEKSDKKGGKEKSMFDYSI